MNRTKKIIAVLFTIAMICGILAACGDGNDKRAEDPIVGTWEMTSAKTAGQEISIDQYLQAAGTKDIPTFEFLADKKLKAKNFAGISNTGAWTVSDGKYTLTFTRVTYASPIKDNTISIDTGGATLIFTKK